MEEEGAGVLLRPSTAGRRRYVLWINYLYQHDAKQSPLAAYPNASYLVGASKSPAGPFAVVNPAAKTWHSGGGDFTLLVDDGVGYLAYDAWSNGHAVTVERLDAAFYNGAASPPAPPLSPKGNEAPLLFKRNGWYYLLFGHTCCFCSTGAGARVLVSPHPLGNWTDTGVDINPVRPGWFAQDHVIKSQNNFVFAASTRPPPDGSTSGGNVTYVFTADRWQSAPDKLKSHDLQYWAPLTFDDSKTPPAIAPLVWTDSFVLDLP